MKIIILFLFPLTVFSQSSDDIFKAKHLLSRLSFGPKPGEVEILAKKKQKGLKEWIETQMGPASISDTEVENELKSLPTLSMSNSQRLKEFPRPGKLRKEGKTSEKKPRQILSELINQKLIRAVSSQRQLQEVMTDFWFNHFNVDFSKGLVKWLITSYERDSIRPNVFGNFRQLLGATAHDPAMLFYLDGFQSVKDGFRGKGINENYARELMELHTLGVDGGYTQNDIKEVARALTGWTIEAPQFSATYIFRKKAHDDGSKTIMKLNIPAGGGEDDGEKVLDYLASHPSTAKFIARKLCVKFIADNPPESAVQKVADEFLSSKGDLKQVYRKLFSIDEFWDQKYRNAKIKTPFEFTVSAIRALNGEVVIFKRPGNQLIGSMDRMGQTLYRCQPPTGFKATSDFWVNPGALVNRIQLGLALGMDHVKVVYSDLELFENKLKLSGSVERSVNTLDDMILQGSLGAKVKERFINEINKEPAVQKEIPVSKLLGLILGSPEFQRR